MISHFFDDIFLGFEPANDNETEQERRDTKALHEIFLGWREGL